jgi:NADH-quinone oxidoreductase subunit L
MVDDRLLAIVPFLILLLPLAGFTVLALFGDRIRQDKEENGAGLLACATVLLCFGLAAWCAWHFSTLERAREASFQTHRDKLQTLGVEQPQVERLLKERERPFFVQPFFRAADGQSAVDWIAVGGLHVPFGLLVDRLTLVMILVVTGVGSLIHIYSLGYMAHDPERVRYFSYLNLFTFFMLLLVMGGSLPLMFVGWEGVGLCSYLLIGFWFKKKSASDAGKKAFIVNRVGDVGLILGTILAFYAFGTVDLVEIADGAASIAPEALGQWGLVTAVCLLLFLGACGKSAQIPLHVWLPDAMEGPTPVSALIHAATMVTAGVYMVARLGPLFAHSATAMAVVATVGAVTALMAATVALVQTDIKRVLAYSTVSQLGYMFLACGVGAFGVAVFHLFTHAFFKALLFLGSGSVIHALSGEQDMRKMGGLRKKIPWTFGTFAVGTAAIAGIPPLAGFFSKDEILAEALGAGKMGLFFVGLGTALLTAFYMGRCLFLTFFGTFRGDEETEHHIHESPMSMVGPLLLLAAGSVLAGFVHVPHYLTPVFRLEAGEEAHFAWLKWLVAPAVAVIGLTAAYYLYVMYTTIPERIATSFRPVRRVLEEKYGFDHAFNWIAGRLVVGGSTRLLWKRVDAGVIDGTVNGTATLVDQLARGVRLVQSGLVRGYALLILGGAVALVGYLVWLR